jgi:hypothetical protein
MGIKKLIESLPDRETLNSPVSIPFTPSMKERFALINRELYALDKRLNIHDFARKAINNMLDEVEKLLTDESIKEE